MPKEIQPKIEISDESMSKFAALGIDPAEFADRAFEEWDEWLGGNRRPETLSELEVERLYDIFSQTSSPKILTETTLVRNMRFPLGRARYLLAAVRKKYPKINSPRIREIIDSISGAQPKQGKYQNTVIAFPIMDNEVYIFKEIAQERSWGVKQFTIAKAGLGQYEASVSDGLKGALIQELKGYE